MGHEGVVMLLSGPQATDPDRPDNPGGIPLSHATSSGSEGVELLEARKPVETGDVNPPHQL
jgi:hypothetical protein